MAAIDCHFKPGGSRVRPAGAAGNAATRRPRPFVALRFEQTLNAEEDRSIVPVARQVPGNG
jgi:hypothetical protein